MYFLRDFARWSNQTDGNPTEIQQKHTNPSKLRQNCWEIPTPTTNQPLKPRQYTYLPTLHPLGASISPSTTLQKTQNSTILLKNHDFWVKSLCVSLGISHVGRTKPMEILPKSSKNGQIPPTYAKIAGKFRHLPPTNRLNLANIPI